MTDLERFAEIVEHARVSRSPADRCVAEEALFAAAPELIAVAKAARAHMPGSWHEKSPIGYGESRVQLDRTLRDLDAKLAEWVRERSDG